MAKRGRGQDKRGRSKSAPFVMLAHAVLDHPAWGALSPYAKEALIFLARRHKGALRYQVMASRRFISKGVGRSEDRVEKSVAELVDAGFIVAEHTGCMGVEGRGVGTIWRLTFLPAAGIGETHDYRTIWTELEQEKNSESRPVRRGKGCPVRRGKGLSADVKGAPCGGARDGGFQAEPAPCGGATLKILPGGSGGQTFRCRPAGSLQTGAGHGRLRSACPGTSRPFAPSRCRASPRRWISTLSRRARHDCDRGLCG